MFCLTHLQFRIITKIQQTKNNQPIWELNVGAAANTSFGYYLTLTGLDKAACVSLATLNLGTSAKGYGVNISSPDSTTSFNTSATSGNAKLSAITPAEAATVCAKTDSTNTVTYFMK